MSLLEAPPQHAAGDAAADVPAAVPQQQPSAATGEPEPAHPAHPAGPVWASAVAAALGCGVAAALVGGLFQGAAATVLAALAALGGCLLAAAAARSPRPVLWHLTLAPAVAAAAAAGALPGAPDALGRLGALVADAVNAGRTQPAPLAFDPGWRPILVAAFALLGFAAAWVAAGMRRPRLALLVPLPVATVGALALPPSAEARTAVAAGVFLFAALAVLHATEPSRAPASAPVLGAARAGVMLAFVAVAVAGLARVDALFPEPRADTTANPSLPATAPPVAEDRVLFEVTGTLAGPWRLGALDVYDDGAWLARPPRPGELEPVPSRPGTRGAPTATITIGDLGDLGDGRVLPVPPGLLVLDGIDASLHTATGTVVARRPPAPGASYVVAAILPPRPAGISTADLHTGDGDRGESAALAAPVPPARVEDLLAALPADPWQRFLALRARLADAFVAAGGGGPVPTPPEQVADLLDGIEGTPYERAAAEALLARWSGVPARVGFGYAGGDHAEGRRLIRARHGAYWVEVRLADHGWVPILPDAVRAAPGSGRADLLTPTEVTPSDEVPVELVVPVRRTTPVLLHQRARGALATALVPAAVAGVLWTAWPMAARWERRRRRRAWAAAAGPRAQVAVAYAEWRDLAIDAGTAGRGRTPLGFCALVAPDAEHEQLAWLVTRALYGDLAGTLDDEDARAAEDLARSLRRRLLAAQPIERRLAACVSRASLRAPYSTEVPAAPRLALRTRAGPQTATARSSQPVPTGATT